MFLRVILILSLVSVGNSCSRAGASGLPSAVRYRERDSELRPADDPFAGRANPGYAQRVRSLLLAEDDLQDTNLIMVVLPPWAAEGALVVRRTSDNKYIVIHSMASVSIAANDLGHADEVRVNRREAPIDSETAEMLIRLWHCAIGLAQFQPIPAVSQGRVTTALDAVSYHFGASALGIPARSAVAVSPSLSSVANRLAAVGDDLSKYADAQGTLTGQQALSKSLDALRRMSERRDCGR